MRYLFDTNLFRSLPFPIKETDTAEQIKRSILKNGDRLVACVETVYELLSHVNESERGKYFIFHKAISGLLHYTDETITDHADYAMQVSLLGRARHQSVTEGALELVRIIRDSRTFERLTILPLETQTPGGLYLALLGHIQSFTKLELDAWEDEWASMMTAGAAMTLECDYHESVRQGIVPKVSDEKRRKALEALDSEQTQRIVMRGMAIRAGVESPVPEENVDRLMNDLSAFYCAYKGIWRKALTSGYNFFGRKNLGDFIDMQLLMHLIESDILLITLDDRVCKLLPADCQQRDRVISYSQLAARFGLTYP